MWYNTWYYYRDINAIANNQYIKYKWYDKENKMNNKKQNWMKNE